MGNKKGSIPWNKGKHNCQVAWNKLDFTFETLYDLYYVKKLSTTAIAGQLNCSTTTVRNWLARFGIKTRSVAEAVSIQRHTWSNEKELARARAYHKTWVTKSKEEKNLSQQKRLMHPNTNSKESIEKAKITKLKNGTCRISKAETKFRHTLELLGFELNDIICQYYDQDHYPFCCDFYIRSQDLFIEYQGHWSHGTEPYKNTAEQNKKLSQYRSKNMDMTTWTERDPLKLNIALKNNINLVLVYPRNKCYFISNGNISTIDINDINKL